VRPRVGQVTHLDGTQTPVVYERIDAEEARRHGGGEMFRPVDLDGHPVQLAEGDRLHVDVLGPGQGILASAQGPADR
jgi:hypothetical protein